MKHFLPILLFLPFLACGQVTTWRDHYNPQAGIWINAGEYNLSVVFYSTGKVYDASSGVLVDQGLTKIIGGAGGAHTMYVLDSLGNVWFKGDNHNGCGGVGDLTDRSTFTKILTDSIGNAFTNVVQIVAGGSDDWNAFALKSDGTAWKIGGTGHGGLDGNGTWGAAATTRPIQIPGLSNIKKIAISFFGMALNTFGRVLTWGSNFSGGSQTPFLLAQGTSTPVTLTPTLTPEAETGVPVVDICGGSSSGGSYILLSNHHLYGTAYHINELSAGISGDMSTYGYHFVRVDTAYAHVLTAPIAKIRAVNTAMYMIASDGSLYSVGSTASGEAGTGLNIDFSNSSSAWSQDNQALVINSCQRVAPGYNKFFEVADGQALVFFGLIWDSLGNVYAMGRNKTANLLLNYGCPSSNLQGDLPNAFDVSWIARVKQFHVGGAVFATYPQYCILHPGFAHCSEASFPAHSNPTADAGGNKTVSGTSFTLYGRSSAASGYNVNYLLYTQVSGPSTLNFSFRTEDTVLVTNAVPGTYVIRQDVTDNGWQTSTNSVTITVVAAGAPTAPYQKIRARRRKYVFLRHFFTQKYLYAKT